MRVNLSMLGSSIRLDGLRVNNPVNLEDISRVNLVASVGERVRFFFGVGGPNLDSAFHIVGLAWDQVHPEGAAETLSDVQTTLVPPGGATMTELTLTVPGTYMMEDHHISRLEKGAFAHLRVQGADNPTEFEQNAHHDASTPLPAAPQTPVLITEEPLP